MDTHGYIDLGESGIFLTMGDWRLLSEGGAYDRYAIPGIHVIPGYLAHRGANVEGYNYNEPEDTWIADDVELIVAVMPGDTPRGEWMEFQIE